jgi:glycosyltransferase involved in cell wall biosynthesis
MHIGFDAKRAIQNNTGLGNYSRYLIEILSEYYPGNSYILFAPKRKQNARLKTICSRKNISFVFPRGISKLLASLWRVWSIKRDIRENLIEIYHGLSNELPVGIRKNNIKTVVTIHDLIFLHYPGYYKLIDRIIYRFKFKLACRNADQIIAVSECTKQDIVSFFHIPASKIAVVYQGCHPMFSSKVPEAEKRAIAGVYQLPPLFLLTVGSIEARKNLMLIIKAMKHIPEDIHLVAVGKSTLYQQEVETYAGTSGIAPRLHVLNNVSFDDLPAIYQSAAICIYPSFYEGFGIPIIEALTSGIPVIAATGSCLEEAGGPGSVYVEPTDEIGLSKQIITIINDKEQAKRMVEAGKEYVKRFSGKSIAAEIMKVYGALFPGQSPPI